MRKCVLGALSIAPQVEEASCVIKILVLSFLLKRCPSLKITLPFLLLLVLLPRPCAYGTLRFCRAPQSAHLLVGWDGVRFMNCLINQLDLQICLFELCSSTEGKDEKEKQ